MKKRLRLCEIQPSSFSAAKIVCWTDQQNLKGGEIVRPVSSFKVRRIKRMTKKTIIYGVFIKYLKGGFYV